MKNTLMLLAMLIPFIATGASMLMNWQGAWVSGTMYHITPIFGTNQNQAPVVTHSGHTYILITESGESATVPPESAPSNWELVS